MARLDRSGHRYPADQSPLYRLENKRRLAEALVWRGNPRALDDFVARDDNYNEFVERKSGRLIQEPKEGLRRLHRRLASLLLRITVPDYLHSGLRGRSYITNAAVHAGLLPTIKLDVKAFFASTTWHHVYRYFHHELECAADVAGLLATLACVKKLHLPTGSCLSQILAFRVHERMFDEMSERATRRGGVITIYVDDAACSVPQACPADIKAAAGIIRRHGLKSHKARFFRGSDVKAVTGTIIKNGRLGAPNRLHKKLQDSLRGIDAAPDVETKIRAARTAVGLARSIAQVDSSRAGLADALEAKFRGLTQSADIPESIQIA